MVKDKLRELIKLSEAEYSDQNVENLHSFFKKNPIRFKKYFDNENGQLPTLTAYNNSGVFEWFRINENYPFGTLIIVKMENKEVFVQIEDVFFD